MQHKKRYSPIQIKNPTSDNHIVRIHPEQEFMVSLTEDVGEVDVAVKSEHIKLTGTKCKGNRKEFYFGQKSDLADWSEISRTHLGEVILLCKNRDNPVVLSVILESPQNSNMLTYINPTGVTAKLSPDMVLEVVLYDKGIGENDKWDFRIVPGERKIKVEKGWHETLLPEFQDNDYFSVNLKQEEFVRRSSDRDVLENHFWFKFDDYSKRIIENMSPGLFNAGRIVFDVRGSDGMFRNDIVLQLNLKQKYQKFSPDRYCKNNNLKDDLVSRHITSTWPNRHSSESSIVLANSSHRTYTPPVIKKEEPQRQTIQIKEKDKVSLDSDCFWVYHNDFSAKAPEIIGSSCKKEIQWNSRFDA